MQELLSGEIMGKAQMLMKIKGDGALEHANMMAERMQKANDEEYLVYWQKIVTQIELLIEGGHG